MRLIHWVLFALQIILIVPTSLALISPIISPEWIYWPALFALLFPFLLLAQMLFFVYWLIKLKWPALISLGVLIIAIPAIDRMVQLGYSARVQDAGAFQVVTYNMHNFRELEEKEEISTGEALEQWKAFERSMNQFDILAFQEYGGYSDKVFKNIHGFPHSAQCDKSRDIRIYSRYRILNSGCVDLIQADKNQALWADILLPAEKSSQGTGDTIRVYSIHLASSQMSHISTEMAQDPKLDAEYLYTNTRTMFARYKQRAPMRLNELNILMDHVAETDLPTLLCGDFNETPQSYLYRKVIGTFKDSFVQGGRGMGDTYAGSVPFLRIDYIFTSDDFKVMDYKKGKEIEFSDHYPVVASLKRTES